MVCSVHLIGSVALDDAETVFRTLSGELGPFLKRIPDGETGKRSRWIRFQHDMMLAHPDMEIDPAAPIRLTEWDGALLREENRLRFREGTDLSAVAFETGYADAAIESFDTFRRLQGEGVIPAGVRFQVSLPSAMASAHMYVSPAARDDYMAVYEREMVKEVAAIAAAVPHDQLSIQWDICQEVLVFEGYFDERPGDYKERIFAEFARLAAAVPDDVELGYHFCYGTPRDKHLVMPKDTAILVEMMNGLFAAVGRRVDFVHVPVPADRDDDAYFAPLAGLDLPEGTELYIGMIHHGDEAGNKRRADAARRAVARFGIASECGWGRADPEKIPGLIAGHRHLAEALG